MFDAVQIFHLAVAYSMQKNRQHFVQANAEIYKYIIQILWWWWGLMAAFKKFKVNIQGSK